MKATTQLPCLGSAHTSPLGLSLTPTPQPSTQAPSPQAPGPGAPAAALGVGGESPLSTRHDDAFAGPLSDPRAEPGPVQDMGLRRMK